MSVNRRSFLKGMAAVPVVAVAGREAFSGESALRVIKQMKARGASEFGLAPIKTEGSPTTYFLSDSGLWAYGEGTMRKIST